MMARIGLRQARNFLAVAESQCLTHAARSLMRSQTAVTKTIQELERQFALSLFERSARGVRLTPYGEALLPHLREAAAAFRRGEQLLPVQSARRSTGAARFLCMDVSDHWIDAFVAVAERGSLASAASYLKLTSAAVSTSIRKLEDALHLSLFERTATGLMPTSLCRAVLEHVKLARNHLQRACDEVLSRQQGSRGQVRVGTLPSVQTTIVPHATLRLLRDYPQLDVSTLEAPYTDLVASLKSGDIDLIVGALRGGAVDPTLQQERLLDDDLSLVARKGHALEGQAHIDWPDLLRYEWILSMQDTPARELFAQAMQQRGLAPPAHFIETSSFAMLRGVLLESDRITVCSRHQIYYDEMHGLLTALPFELHETRRSIGILYRRNGAPSRAAELLMQNLREVATEISAPLGARQFRVGQPCMGLTPP